MPRQSSPVSPPVVVTIAGSDSGGGAGIQADLKTIEASGAFGTSVLTSVTAQNTTGVESTHLLPVAEIEAQLEAVLDDFDVAAVKTGMLATREIIETVTEYADELPALVVDPVMVAATGDRLLEPEAEDAYEDLIARATLVTPNADEATVLTDREVDDPEAARAAGREIVEMGADAALVKGGHVPGETVVDTLVTDDGVRTIHHDRIETDATHGSGCALSSAIATRLAHGDDLGTAVGSGIDLLSRAVRYNLDVGTGPGAVHHLVETRNEGARTETVEAVETIVDRLVDRDASPLVPAGGMDVLGATPYAERPDEIAAVEGGIAETVGGVRPNRGVRFGVADRGADRLLGVREAEPAIRFGTVCRFDDTVESALAALSGPTVAVESTDDYRRRVREVMEAADGRPTAVIDRAGPTEPTVTVLASEPGTVADRTLALLDALGT